MSALYQINTLSWMKVIPETRRAH